MHDARSVANQILLLACNDSSELTPMQVLKLVYFCHAWSLGIRGKPMIKQPVVADTYGPNIKELYKAIAKYGTDSVIEDLQVPTERYTDEESALIKEVYDIYGQLNGLQLSSLAHAPGTPWSQTKRHFMGSKAIPNSLIREYYAALAVDGDEEE